MLTFSILIYLTIIIHGFICFKIPVDFKLIKTCTNAVYWCNTLVKIKPGCFYT